MHCMMQTRDADADGRHHGDGDAIVYEIIQPQAAAEPQYINRTLD